MPLEEALREWLRAALTFIHANGGVVRGETDTWVRDGTRFVRRTWNRLVYRPETAHRSLRLPEFASVLAEIRRDLSLQPMFGRYVGPTSGMGTLFNEVNLLNRFLPHDIDPHCAIASNPARLQALEFDPRVKGSYRPARCPPMP